MARDILSAPKGARRRARAAAPPAFFAPAFFAVEGFVFLRGGRMG